MIIIITIKTSMVTTCMRTAFSRLSTLRPFFFSNSCRSGARDSALQKANV